MLGSASGGGDQGGSAAEDGRPLVQAGRLLPRQAPLVVRARLRRPPPHRRKEGRLLRAQAPLQEQQSYHLRVDNLHQGHRRHLARDVTVDGSTEHERLLPLSRFLERLCHVCF